MTANVTAPMSVTLTETSKVPDKRIAFTWKSEVDASCYYFPVVVGRNDFYKPK